MSDSEPRFVVKSILKTHDKHPGVILFRLASKAQPRSNPQQWYKSVEEFLEPEESWSPLFVLKADQAVALARDLLNAAHDSQGPEK